MQRKLNIIGLGMATSIALLASNATLAQQDTLGYVVDPFNNAVVDPFGDCVRTPFRTLETPPAACEQVAVVAPPETVVQTLTLEADTFFDFDKSVVKPEGQQVLNRLAQDIQAADSVSVVSVVGHTDAIGTESYNQGLSERRAAAVADYLIQQGVNPNLIRTRGMGEAQPVATNATPEGRAQNRRVDVIVEAQERVIRQ